MGFANEPGTTLFSQRPPTEPWTLQSVPIGFLEDRHDRGGDVEAVALRLVLSTLSVSSQRVHCTSKLQGITGSVQIFVDRVSCLSCLGLLKQFQARLPGVRLQLGFRPHEYH